MADSMRIEIRNYTWGYYLFLIFGIVMLFFGFFVVCMEFSVGLLVFYLLLLVFFVVYCILYEIVPTVLIANERFIRWRHLGKTSEIALGDIKNLCCEPYVTRSRYGTFQRIRLTVYVKDDNIGSIDFTDSVDASALLTDIVAGNQSDIALIQVYQYLKEQTGL